jgi:competence protein ComEA
LSRPIATLKGFDERMVLKIVSPYCKPLLVISSLVFLLFPLQGQSQSPTNGKLQDEYPDLPQGPGRDTVIRVCGSCHAADNVVSHGQSREDWEATVGTMAGFGMSASDEEVADILDYLAKNFPKPAASKVDVNKATAVDLELELGFSTKDAEAIVGYRKKNGDYKSFEDLKKVPDMDQKKLDENKDRLTYD